MLIKLTRRQLLFNIKAVILDLKQSIKFTQFTINSRGLTLLLYI